MKPRRRTFGGSVKHGLAGNFRRQTTCKVLRGDTETAKQKKASSTWTHLGFGQQFAVVMVGNTVEDWNEAEMHRQHMCGRLSKKQR